MLWNGVERFGTSLFLFISNLVLARLLSPDDFGCIGMLMVFISISDSIIDCGFGSALIQKKDSTDIDYSTIFFWNVILSVILYSLLFLSSPFIADFYQIPLLSDVLKVQGLVLFTYALVLIQQTKLRKELKFKRIAQINLFSVVVGTIVGIACAFKGFGVWSLVTKSLVTGALEVIIYWCWNKWRPILAFDYQSFKKLFSFGSFIFFNGILNSIYNSFLSLIIGKRFSAAQLGYYTQAHKLQDVPRSSLSSVITNVAYSAFSIIQDEKKRLSESYLKSLRLLNFINIPMLVFMFVAANEIFYILFGLKWINAVPYFQILCIAGIAHTMLELECSVLNSIGKSRLVFNVNNIQYIIGIVLILLGSLFGMECAIIGFALTKYIGCMIMAVYISRFINCKLSSQIRGFVSYFVVSLIASFLVYLSTICISDIFISLFLKAILFFSVYILISNWIFKEEIHVFYSEIFKGTSKI